VQLQRHTNLHAACGTQLEHSRRKAKNGHLQIAVTAPDAWGYSMLRAAPHGQQ